MRFKQANDAFREQWNVVPEDITKTDKGLLKQMLDNTIESYKSQNISDLDKYYFAFVECIENVFPDEPWYENIGLDIRMDLFNTRSPEETAQHIVDAITDADAYVEENKVLTEDTVKKSNGKWTNRGDDGKEHGEFSTKKEADAQRKAMYANGYKSESLNENLSPQKGDRVRMDHYSKVNNGQEGTVTGRLGELCWVTWDDGTKSKEIKGYLAVIERDGKVVNESLTEKANPENAEVNKLIHDVATGKSRAFQRLKKLGYDVEIDDEARKEFGREYFGDTITITNPKTGNTLVGNTGEKKYGFVTNDYLRANTKTDKGHMIRPGKYSKEVTASEKDFDYKSFLDKNHEKSESPETTISQFKKDKQLIKDNQVLYKRLQDADSRLSDIRDKLASRKVVESYDEPEAPGKGYTAPVISDYTRDIKEAVLWLKNNPDDDMATKELSDIALLLRQEYRNLREFNEYWTKRYAAMTKFINEQMGKIPEEFR